LKQKTFTLLLFIFLSITCFSQKNRIAIFDLTLRNAEANDGNKFSIEHLLKVSGLPYFVTDSVNLALQSKLIICSSNIEPTSFSQIEKDSLISFVQNGGYLFVTQLKDTILFPLFGVSDYQYGTNRYEFEWEIDNTNSAFRWLDDVNEKTIRLADTSYAASLNTRSYMLTTATALATFEDDSAACIKNNYGLGAAYVLGINWKDIVLRNQVGAHYKAARTYSNDFEPGTDVFMLFIKALYIKHNDYAVWKHTSGLNSKSSLIITHDVDATSAIKDIMNDFASYEKTNNIQATYFITTHYMHDSLAKNFWNGYTQDLINVKNKGHEIASHSVSHVPDFDNESIVPEGTCGNTELSYQPFYNGMLSTNVTVCGETEVSKLLLDRDVNANVKSFRAGYLAYNKKILNSLETNNYAFNSSSSANDVLTAFPFQGHLDLSMNGALSTIYEIPNTISDVFMIDPISEYNYNNKVAQWLNSLKRNADNYAASLLLIHPNRLYKIQAEQNLIRSLPNNTRIIPFEHYGNYWKARENCSFDYQLENDSVLKIIIKNSSLPLHHDLSFVVDKGMLLHKIYVVDENNNPINLLQEQWETDSKILFSERFSENYATYYYTPDGPATVFANYPNPFSTHTTFSFELMKDAQVVMKIYDVSGRFIEEPINDNLELGLYHYSYTNTHLSDGLYFYSITIDDEKPVVKKLIVSSQP
jgi:peptidoglycan/xylan/chitin deacetylase (PgdA/CDA1 family)